MAVENLSEYLRMFSGTLHKRLNYIMGTRLGMKCRTWLEGLRGKGLNKRSRDRVLDATGGAKYESCTE